MIVFGSSLSPFVRKVLVFAAEKGIEVENRQTGLQSADPGFIAASPFRKIPALQDGDYCLADSSAIVQYLEAKYPAPALIPAEPRARGTVVWFDEFADTIAFAPMGRMFFNRIVGPRFMGVRGDEAVAAAAEAELPPILGYLEGVVPDGGFLVGDALTLADIAVASPFVNLAHLGVVVDAGRHPRLTRYLGAIHARPSFAALIAREQRFLAAAGPRTAA